jgi:diacylglycerol kinase (ATP)
VEAYRARTVRLIASGVTAYADGDPIATLPITIDAVPAALTVLTPTE